MEFCKLLPELNFHSFVQNEIWEFLEQLVSIDSQTKNVNGVNRVQDLLAAQLQSMGLMTEFVENTEQESGKLLIAKKRGITRRKIVFICHADTVTRPSNNYCYQYSSREDKCFGSGIADNKGGVVLGLYALKEFLQQVKGRSFYSLMFICSPNEETGSPGFTDLFSSLVSPGDYVFGLEPALSDGRLISSRCGNRWYDIEVKGRAAHSGRLGPHINAAHQAGLFMGRFQELNQHAKNIKVNIGSIASSNDKFNVVCPEIQMKLDTRFASFQDREKLHYQICEILQNPDIQCPEKNDFCQSSFIIADDCPPMGLDEFGEILINRHLKKISSIENRDIGHGHSGGAADINYLSAPGVISVDGLGPIADFMHTRREYIVASSLITRLWALVDLLVEMPIFQDIFVYENNEKNYQRGVV